jgi:outer membrane lipoprotein LolB
VAARDADQGWSGEFVWTWTAPSYQLSLQGPLHQQGALIEGDASGVRARLANGAEVTAPDAETLLAQQLGVSLPVTQLRAWVLGIPAADLAIDTLQFDAEGRLQVLEQAGWRVEYQAHQAVGAWYLPKRLTLNYEAIQARLVLDAWRVP